MSTTRLGCRQKEPLPESATATVIKTIKTPESGMRNKTRNGMRIAKCYCTPDYYGVPSSTNGYNCIARRISNACVMSDE